MVVLSWRPGTAGWWVGPRQAAAWAGSGGAKRWRLLRRRRVRGRAQAGRDAAVVLVGLGAGQVAAGEVAEGQGRAEGDAAGRIVPAHHRGLVVAGRVQARNRLAGVVEHPGAAVGGQAGEGAEAARDDPH